MPIVKNGARRQGFASPRNNGAPLTAPRRSERVLRRGKGEVCALTERVEVNAAPPTLQTADSQMGGVVESRAISDLPLNGRNFTQLMVLMAGATEGSQGDTTQGHYNERAGGVSFSVNGQRSDYNEFLIDGIDAKEVQHGTNTIEPIIDALQEFRVQTANYSPEFGGQAGGQINAVIKSGTNGFHGTLWEFLRNNDLDTNNFFNNLTGVPIAGFHRNQFGAAAGGPVLLPKYNGRNRTFIFGAYEGTRIVKGITQLTTVPTAAQRAGNFGSQVVTDPFTGAPFSGNVIPANRINPITNTIMQKWVPLSDREIARPGWRFRDEHPTENARLSDPPEGVRTSRIVDAAVLASVEKKILARRERLHNSVGDSYDRLPGVALQPLLSGDPTK